MERLLAVLVLGLLVSGLVASAGRSAAGFNVAGAASLGNTSISVTFDAPPDSTQATTLANYAAPGLTLSGTPHLSGNTVTITTSAQAVQSYTVTVSGVTRVTDGAPLTTTGASFTGKTGFNVVRAASMNRTTLSVTFDALPDGPQAATLSNYSVPGLTLLGTPVLSGNTVTITTSSQAVQGYTVTVSGVTRASDTAPLSVDSASFSYGPATIDVNTTSDVAPTGGECAGAPGDCSLRQALDAAQPGDTIQLLGTASSPAVYNLTLGSTLVVSQDVTILGNGPDATVIDGLQNLGGPHDEQYRIMKVAGATVSIVGVTFQNGIDANDENFTGCSPCETLTANGGGALFNAGGSVTLDDVAFTSDAGSANPIGGGVSNGSGTLTMTNVSFANDGAAFGAGLFVRSGTVSGTGVTFENDGSGGFGGGALYLAGGTATLTNATIVGNGSASTRGGGIVNAGGTLTLNNDTFSGNLRGAIETDQGGATTSVGNTIIGAGFSDNVDYACIAANQTNGADNTTTAAAITTDLGNNIDQDGHCGLSGAGDVSNADPKLASIADNGGPTRTQALLAGSPALEAGNDATCPATDQRGTTRPQGAHCDIGAFEAVLLGPPTATTEGAQNIQETQADLGAQINLDGEPGGFHFLWGTSADALTNSTAVSGAGVVSTNTAETQTLYNLSPGTTYYYKAVADNATASVAASNVLSFTTQAGPPAVYSVSLASVTDTTATIDFTIDPNGADTTYVVEYGPDTSYGQQTQSIDIGSSAGGQQLNATLTGLTPGSTYHFDVVASNSVQQNVDGGDQTFTTDRQITGTAGSQVNLVDNGSAYQCPAAPTITWGDGSDPTQAQAVTCTPGNNDETDYEVTATHTYASAGRYHVQITYSDLGSVVDQYAVISAAGPQALTVAKSGTGSGSVTSSPVGIDCGATCSYAFDYGTLVTLTAAPAASSNFGGWSGACTGAGSCQVTMDQARSVTATFILKSETLSVADSGTGSGTESSDPAGISCGATCSHDFDYGTLVTLTATAADGSTFAGWSGACTGTGTCQVTMDQAATVTATFTENAPPPPGCVVPKVKGKTLAAAKRAIENANCSVGKVAHAASKKVAKGKVISQSAPAGKHLAAGAKVNLVVSKGKKK